MFVKICGLTTSMAVATAAEAGADAVGFVFADSPRRVTPQQAAALSQELPAGVLRVAVMRRPSPADWATVRDAFDPDWLQADAGPVAALQSEVDARILPVYRDTPDLNEAQLAAAPLVLFEGRDSGHGERVDWHRAARLAARTRLILAGGLDPENVAEAVCRVRPFGVDVSSGVERARGIKDLGRIRAFVAAVREAETVRAD